nr:MAG TPA: portal protein [Caudoviricetes sp.]
MILEYLIKAGYRPPESDWYGKVEEYLAWYQGDVKAFHHYTVYNGTRIVGVRRYSLGMAKVVAEDHASLLLNEKVKINPGGGFSPRLEQILQANNFRVRGNQLVELAFALGTGAFVEYLDQAGKPVLDYIRANMIYPLSWENEEITECAFGSVQTAGGKKRYYVQLHLIESDGYVIRNVYLDAESGKELPPPKGMQAEVRTKSPVPLFQILKPNLINNYDLDCPMGMSIYGNALDVLRAVDLVWDSYVNEFVLGRKRIMVPMSMAKIQMEKDGTAGPLFDPHDTIYYVYQQEADGKNELKEINMTIRSDEHESALQRALNLLSKKCGLGNDRYQFDSSGGIKTATEVISEKSELFQTLKKNELVINAALIGMTQALAFLDGRNPGIDVSIAFDDSIIEDRQAKQDDHIKLTGAGLESKLRAVMDLYKLSEADAQKELERIAQESAISGTPEDWYSSEGGGLNDTGTA